MRPRGTMARAPLTPTTPTRVDGTRCFAETLEWGVAVVGIDIFTSSYSRVRSDFHEYPRTRLQRAHASRVHFLRFLIRRLQNLAKSTLSLWFRLEIVLVKRKLPIYILRSFFSMMNGEKEISERDPHDPRRGYTRVRRNLEPLFSRSSRVCREVYFKAWKKTARQLTWDLFFVLRGLLSLLFPLGYLT